MIGHLVEYTKSFTICVTLAGTFPLIGFVALVLLWGREEAPAGEAIPSGLEVSAGVSPTAVRRASDVDGVATAHGQKITR